jgi:cyclohexanone monooxygenase
MEAKQDAEDKWVAHVNEVATPRSIRRPIPGTWAPTSRQAAIFMPYIGGVGVYRRICDEVAAKGYEGFREWTRADAAAPSLAGSSRA